MIVRPVAMFLWKHWDTIGEQIDLLEQGANASLVDCPEAGGWVFRSLLQGGQRLYPR